MYDFDSAIDRTATGSIKWDKYAGRDILPLWVADMDFAAPPPILAALHAHIQAGDLGYSHAPAALASTVADFIAETHGWQIDPDWIVWLPGLVCGLNVACRTFGAAGVITQTPVYPPFLSAPALANQKLVTVDMLDSAAGWQIDWQGLQASFIPRQLLLLCNPHNPVGRAYDADELEQLARLAAEHDLIVCADEIHADLLLDRQRRHIPFASLNNDTAQRTVTLMAPSKTFNIPGLGSALAIAANPQLRRRLQQTMAGIVPHTNGLAWPATMAAYRDCREWRRQLLAYLRGNRDLLQMEIKQLPGLRMHAVEATYLAWIDCRQLGLDDPARHFEAHGLGLSDGRDFGAPGFVRLNFGCPRSRLQLALQRLAQAVTAISREP